jgi:hypothetical protein
MQVSVIRPYPIMDETGKVRKWLADGRNVRVWRSAEIGTNRPDMLTPGDSEVSPHWAYPLNLSEVLKPEDVTFFKKGSIVYRDGGLLEWSDTAAGLKAAEKAIRTLPEDNGDAPHKFVFEYTIERVCYETREKNDLGTR